MHTLLRRLGIFVLLLPALLAAPLYYWAFSYAGTWYVSTRLDAKQRAADLVAMWLLDLVMLACLTVSPGLLLLFISGCRRSVIVWLLIPAALLLAPGFFLLFISIDSYIKYSH
jgi:hypothetical protein